MSCLVKLLLLPVAIMRRVFQIFHKRAIVPVGNPPVNTVAPLARTITDPTPPVDPTPVGEQAQCYNNGTWTGDETIAFAYQWQRLIDVTWTNIASATNASFTLADLGDHRCRVRGANAAGYAYAYTNTITAIAA